MSIASGDDREGSRILLLIGACLMYVVRYYVGTYVAVLNCVRLKAKDGSTSLSSNLGIFLRRLYEDDQYARVKMFDEDLIEFGLQTEFSAFERSRLASLNIRQRRLLPSDYTYLKDRLYGFRIDDDLLQRDADGNDLFRAQGEWNSAQRTVTLSPGSQRNDIVGILDISKQHRRIQMIKFGFDDNFNPTIFLAETSAMDKNVDSRVLNYNPEAYKSFYEKGSNDKEGWSSIDRSAEKVATAWAIVGQSGMWSLKGDRINGLNVKLTKGMESEDHGHVLISRGLVDGNLVWDVYVKDLRDSATKSIKTAFVALKKGRKTEGRV